MPHKDLDLLKTFCSDIQDGRHVDHLENLQTTSPPKTVSWTELKLDGRHQSNIEVQNHYNLSILISKIVAMVAILKIFRPRLLPNGKSDCAQTWWETLG